MKTLNSNLEKEDVELFGQLSNTGKAFNCGYYLSLMVSSAYFAEGEEREMNT